MMTGPMASPHEQARIERRVELEPTQLRYLETMMARYAIPDVGKAVRVLVNFAMAVPDQEESIFKKTRCRHCV